MKGQMMETGRTVWGVKVTTLKGAEASLFFVQCFLCLISFSTHISIFHSTLLDTFWVDMYNIYYYCYKYILFYKEIILYYMKPKRKNILYKISFFMCLSPQNIAILFLSLWKKHCWRKTFFLRYLKVSFLHEIKKE